jgi:hypothetical protein
VHQPEINIQRGGVSVVGKGMDWRWSLRRALRKTKLPSLKNSSPNLGINWCPKVCNVDAEMLNRGVALFAVRPHSQKCSKESSGAACKEVVLLGQNLIDLNRTKRKEGKILKSFHEK